MKHAFPTDVEPLAEIAVTQGRSAFVERFAHPFLLFTRSRLWDATFLKARQLDSSFATRVVNNPNPNADGGLVLVSGIKKREGSTNAGTGIVLGRALHCDIVLPVASVSSAHASFNPPEKEGAWTLADLESSNCTFINDARIAPYNPMPVSDGDYLRFGSNLLCWFLTSTHFCDLLLDETLMLQHTDP